MKELLKEDIKRMHKLIYGSINESIFDNILTKKVDEPNKADLVSDNVNDLFQTIQGAIDSGGLQQQQRGSITYQKAVESMQIGLTLLNYKLPKFGIDGKFGTETAQAVQEFKKDNSILNENASELRSTLNTLNYHEKGKEITSGGKITDELSNIVSKVLNDFKEKQPNIEVTVTAGNDSYHKHLNYKSKHVTGQAVDVVLKPYSTEIGQEFIKILNKYRSSNFSYIDEYKNPSRASTGGHFHLQVDGDEIKQPTISASPEMLTKLLGLLKQRGVKSEELNSLIDKTKLTPSVNSSDWQGLVNMVIDQLEGGYYHPDMLLDGRLKDNRYSDSGETMFGLDRKAGNNENTEAGKAFWYLIDTQNARKNWKWNYMAKDKPALNMKLKQLAGNYIKPLYDDYSKKFLSPAAQTIVEKSPALKFNFIYATWNGPKWFERFAKKINTAIETGLTDKDSLIKIAIDARKNSGSTLISQTGEKMEPLINQIA